MEISSNNMKSPSPQCYMIFLGMAMNSDTINLSDISLFRDIVNELDLMTDFDLLNLSCLRTFEFRTSLGTSVFAYNQIQGGFNRTFATAMESQKRTLSPVDTWSDTWHHFWLVFVLMLRPVSPVSELPSLLLLSFSFWWFYVLLYITVLETSFWYSHVSQCTVTFAQKSRNHKALIYIASQDSVHIGSEKYR